MGSVEPRLDLVDIELTSVHNVPNPVTGGYDLGSTATVTNLGPGDATGVTLSDVLAPGETFVSAGSDPSCAASAGAVTCTLGDMANGDVATVLIVTETPQVDADTTIHDAFAVAATEDGTAGNDTLDVATEVRAPRADFVAGYVPSSDSTTWLDDATRWSRRDPVATSADPTVAFVGVPGGGPGGPVTVTELPCGAPFACMTARRSHGHFFFPHGVFGNLIQVSIPSGYGASNPIIGVFLDDWSIIGSTWESVQGDVPERSVRLDQRAVVVRRVAPLGSAVRVLDRSFVRLVEPLRVRRPPHRRAVHRWRNVRARPVGCARSPHETSLTDREPLGSRSAPRPRWRCLHRPDASRSGADRRASPAPARRRPSSPPGRRWPRPRTPRR